MNATRLLTQRLLKGGIRLASPLVEQILRNDALRRVVFDELEHRLLSLRVEEDPRRPPRVQQDKVDMIRALIASIDRALERRQISPQVLRKVLRNFLFDFLLLQDERRQEAIRAFKERHEGAFPPTTIVISPTKSCNLRCIGCYANSGPSTERLEWEVFDRIVTEAKTLWGIRFFTISGGEPLVYRSDGKTVLDLAAKHEECFFMMYTNGTLINERRAKRMAEVGNLTPAISVEGFEARTDERRGRGVFRRILEAMACLREAGVPFGISLTATRHNAEEILSDEFIDFFFEEQQVVYGWLFQYMPIGRGFTLELLPTPEQRLWMWRRTWQIIRERKIMLTDFWNCGTVSDGCISAGRSGGYLYIDWNGRVMPCVFVPYSPANIHDIYRQGGTLDDLYDLPYFQGIRHWQWEYAFGKTKPREHQNWILPCPIRDHHEVARELIDRYHPEPEDESAAEALEDEEYYRGMLAYGEALRKVFDPVWEEEYLSLHPDEKGKGSDAAERKQGNGQSSLSAVP
jgi:MoaA/NifB/PqqE/SkfB family radical SAM enzyme